MDPALTLSLVLPWVVIVFQGCLIYVLLRQHGRTLLAQQELQDRLAAAEGSLQGLGERLAGVEQGQGGGEASAELTIGSPAPEFVATDLEGRERKLEEFLGKPLLVVFFSPGCGFCRQMAPRLGQLPEHGPRVLLVSEGDPAEHRQMAEEHNWRCDVVLQRGWEVSNAWGAGGTPTGYLLDAEGRVASSLAIGADALLRLVEAAPNTGSPNGHADGPAAETLHEPAPVAEPAGPPQPTPVAPEPARPVEVATAPAPPRQGLPPGTPAPDFVLPDLNGQQHSLQEFRGKRVLLVFSEPDCAPSQPLVKELARWQRRKGAGELQVVMISRGDPEANREKAREHGVAFPILLQQAYEVSKQYATFATPVAYLIDEQGLIAQDVAVGPDAVLKLV